MASPKLVWLKSLLHKLGTILPSPFLWCDNLGAIFLALNLVFHARTKHIEFNYHFIREKVADDSICVCFICSQDQLVDTLTKPLSSSHFLSLRFKLTVTSVPVCLRGHVSDNVQEGAVQNIHHT
jgi:hypothetical protein